MFIARQKGIYRIIDHLKIEAIREILYLVLIIPVSVLSLWDIQGAPKVLSLGRSDLAGCLVPSSHSSVVGINQLWPPRAATEYPRLLDPRSRTGSSEYPPDCRFPGNPEPGGPPTRRSQPDRCAWTRWHRLPNSFRPQRVLACRTTAGCCRSGHGRSGRSNAPRVKMESRLP